MIKATIKIHENITEEQIKKLIDVLKKTDEFEFFVTAPFTLKPN